MHGPQLYLHARLESVARDSYKNISYSQGQVKQAAHPPSPMFVACGMFSFSDIVMSSLSVLNYMGCQTIECQIIKDLIVQFNILKFT